MIKSKTDRMEELSESQLDGQTDLGKMKGNIRKYNLYNLLIGFHLINGVLIPFFLTWGKLSFFEVMILQSYFTIMIFIFEIPCGAIADYISRKSTLILGALSLSLAVLIYGSIPNLLIFIIGETFFALGMAMISGSDQALIYDTLKLLDRETEINSIQAKAHSLFLLGMMIAAPLGSFLATILPINYAFSLMFIPFMGAMCSGFSLKEPKINNGKEKMSYLIIIKSGFRLLRNNNKLRFLGLNLVIAESLVFFLVWTYQLYLGVLLVPLIYFGLVSSGLTLAQIVFTNIGPLLERNSLDNRKSILIYTLIPGIAYILMALIYFIPISVTLIIIVVGLGFSRNILFVKVINNQIESEIRATTWSTLSMITSIIRAILYPLIGLLVMWSLNGTYIILGIANIICALILNVKKDYFRD